jgi:cleavage stimulation factor subunit 2
LNFRPVHDKETGKPKGFGFAEFADADAAASAVRNLNDFELHGRKLRVDYANENNVGRDDNAGHSAAAPPQDHQASSQSSALPQLPPGRDLGPSLSADDSISRTLNTLPPPQLLDILTQMQSLVNTEPARAQALLEQSPQLSYAIFQALLLLQLVDTATLTSIIQQTAMAPALPPQQVYPPQQTAPPPQQQYPPQAYTPQYPPQQGYPQSNTPVGQPYQPPAQQTPQIPPPLPQVTDRVSLVQQVLSMPQQQIDALPPVERAQIMALRAQLLQQIQA